MEDLFEEDITLDNLTNLKKSSFNLESFFDLISIDEDLNFNKEGNEVA